jgi:hypothetical protein
MSCFYCRKKPCECRNPVKDAEIVDRLENFFNGDNVLTKSEYKQKILEGEKHE